MKHKKDHTEDGAAEGVPVAQEAHAAKPEAKADCHTAEKAADKARKAEKTAEHKLADLHDQHLRLLADFDNYRKRAVREKEEVGRLTRENLLKELLPLVDNVELGLNAATAHKADKVFVDGYKMVLDQLTGALARNGLETIDKEGVLFDPAIHEAVHQAPSEQYPADTVVTLIRKGYRVGDRLLRPAQVVVSTGPAQSPAPAEGTEKTEDTGK